MSDTVKLFFVGTAFFLTFSANFYVCRFLYRNNYINIRIFCVFALSFIAIRCIILSHAPAIAGLCRKRKKRQKRMMFMKRLVRFLVPVFCLVLAAALVAAPMT
ncbi:MAG: hypothetical protein RR284_09165, partial [Ruthenibacterium sp.]